MPARLAVIVDGVPMPDEEARAFWERFSAHMDANKGDLAGFAKSEGFASVHPEMRGGAPVLVVSRTASQKPYATARSAPGSSGPQPSSAKPRGNPAKKQRR